MKNIIIILITLLFVDAALAQIITSNSSQNETGDLVVVDKTYASDITEVTGIKTQESKSDCHSTFDDVYVAGNGDVLVENGANATFVAGETIFIGPGFIAEEGSNVHVYIDSDYCPSMPESIVANQNDDFQPSLEDISIYPNPTNGKFSIDFLNQPLMNAEVFIMDFRGQKIQNLNTQNSEKIDIDLSHLSEGNYLVVIKDADRVITRKIVKM